MSCKQLDKVNGAQGLMGSRSLYPFTFADVWGSHDIDTDSGGRTKGRRSRDKCVGSLTGLSAKRLRNALSRIIKRNLRRVFCIYMAPWISI